MSLYPPQLGTINGGFQLIAAIPSGGSDEFFVMAVNDQGKFVTWRTWLYSREPVFAGGNYFDGANAFNNARRDMMARAIANDL
jgi:hypothetical protein